MVLQMKISPMEQAKEIKMINPVEWEDTHLEAHKRINAAVTQFYRLFDELLKEIKSVANTHEDAEKDNFASFSKIKKELSGLRKDIKLLTDSVKSITAKLNEWRMFVTRRYEWIVDTEKEVTVDLDPITDEELKGKYYLAHTVVNEASPNQWAADYSFPKLSIVHGDYTPRITLKAKEGEHAVLEYDFTVILTEI